MPCPIQVDGAVPVDLEGTLLLGGPGLTTIYNQTVRNPEDGDGMVASLAFEKGKAFFRNKYVRTRTFAAEQVLGRRVSRGFHDAGAPPPSSREGINLPLIGNININLPPINVQLPPGFNMPLPANFSFPNFFNPMDMSFRSCANAGAAFWGGRVMAFSKVRDLRII